MNQQFLQMQKEKIIQERISFTLLDPAKKLQTADGLRMAQEQGLDFVDFKQNLITLIENSDEKALQMRLEATSKRLCKKCRKGLKNYELGCNYDYRNFIVCEYIKRSLSK